MANQQTEEVRFLNFDDGNLEAQVDLHQMFCLGALKRLKALKMQIDLMFVRGFGFFFVSTETDLLDWRANYKI